MRFIKHFVSKKAFLQYAIILALIALFIYFFDVTSLLADLKNTYVPFVFLAAGIHAVQQLVRAGRWASIMKVLGLQPPWRANIAVHLIIPILGRISPGKIGEGAKIFLLKQPKKSILFGFIIERSADFIVLIALAAAVITQYDFLLLPFLVFVGIFLMGLIALWHSHHFIGFFMNFAQRFLPIEVQLSPTWFREHFAAYSTASLTKIALYSVGAWFLNFLALYVLALSIGLKIPFLLFAASIAISTLVGVVSGLPGGIGAREGTAIFLLIQLGATQQLAALYAVVLLAFVLIVEAGVGLIGWMLYHMHHTIKQTD